MRRAAAALLAWVLLVAGAAGAQSVPQVGDLPPGDGTLSGRALRADGTPAAKLGVSLIAFETSGTQSLRRTSTGVDGRFSFAGISPDPSIVYFVIANADGVHHSQRTAFDADRKTLELDVQIAPASTDTRLARRGDISVRFERSCSGLRVTETHDVGNSTRSVLFVPEDARADAAPILDLELPEAAGELASPFGASPPGLEREGRRVRFWGPAYPGDQEIEFSYTLPAEGTALEATWGYPNGASGLRFLADPSVPNVRVEGLPERGTREVVSRVHRSFDASRLGDGTQVTLAVEFGAAPPLGALREAQLWIELDDAALEVDEHLALEPNPDATEASLLCLALPPGAADLRFSQATLALPVARDPSGALELRGPLPPGEQVITLRYRLPAGSERTRFARRFGVPLPLLGVLVSDTGVLAETTRLHRRRPVRRVERNYLHLEAFQVSADETVEIDFSRLAAPRGLPRSATVGFAVLVAGGLMFFLGAPLRGEGTERIEPETPEQQLAAERESVYAAIRDVDEDFNTGKLTAEDHAQLRAELRARAVRLLEAERRGGEAPSETEPAAGPDTTRAAPGTEHGTSRPADEAAWRFCPECGGELPAKPRFCPHCGNLLPGANGGA